MNSTFTITATTTGIPGQSFVTGPATGVQYPTNAPVPMDGGASVTNALGVTAPSMSTMPTAPTTVATAVPPTSSMPGVGAAQAPIVSGATPASVVPATTAVTVVPPANAVPGVGAAQAPIVPQAQVGLPPGNPAAVTTGNLVNPVVAGQGMNGAGYGAGAGYGTGGAGYGAGVSTAVPGTSYGAGVGAGGMMNAAVPGTGVGMGMTGARPPISQRIAGDLEQLGGQVIDSAEMVARGQARRFGAPVVPATAQDAGRRGAIGSGGHYVPGVGPTYY